MPPEQRANSSYGRVRRAHGAWQRQRLRDTRGRQAEPYQADAEGGHRERHERGRGAECADEDEDYRQLGENAAAQHDDGVGRPGEPEDDERAEVAGYENGGRRVVDEAG